MGAAQDAGRIDPDIDPVSAGLRLTCVVEDLRTTIDLERAAKDGAGDTAELQDRAGLHGLESQHVLFALRRVVAAEAAFGRKVEHLAADHAAQSGRARHPAELGVCEDVSPNACFPPPKAPGCQHIPVGNRGPHQVEGHQGEGQGHEREGATDQEVQIAFDDGRADGGGGQTGDEGINNQENKYRPGRPAAVDAERHQGHGVA